MRTFGLIGYPLSHSFSQNFFQNKFLILNLKNCQYLNFPIQNISEIKSVISKTNIEGFNVTNPYKEKVIPFLDFTSENAKEIGSVNTVKIIDDKLYGYNTDIIGFQNSFTPIINNRRNALILGDGGASKSVQFVLNKLNINFELVSRNTEFNYHNITEEIIDSVDIIINCTPLGTYPKADEYPKLPYSLLNSKHLLYDLVYNPKQTKFLTFGLVNNCSVKNGEEMLVLQAEESWNIWNSDIR